MSQFHLLPDNCLPTFSDPVTSRYAAQEGNKLTHFQVGSLASGLTLFLDEGWENNPEKTKGMRVMAQTPGGFPDYRGEKHLQLPVFSSKTIRYGISAVITAVTEQLR